MTPKIRSTNEAKLPYLRAFFYGLPGSGKTTLASTFPAPLFLTLESSVGELRSVSDVEFPMLAFDRIQEFVDVINWIASQIKAGRKIGRYVPQTVVLDNWSSFQAAWEVELINSQDRPDARKLRDRDWGDIFFAGMHAKVKLHNLPINVVHLAHAKERELREKSGNRTIEKLSGAYVFKGDSGRVIPAECNVVSYLEAIDRGTQGTGYYAHLKPYKHWPARIHAPGSSEVPSRLGPGTKEDHHPHYDDLAAIFGMPSAKEAEEAAGVEWN